MVDIESLVYLRDIEEIRQLKYRYCAYCDDGYDADGIASCYAKNGAFGSRIGEPHVQGRDAIRDAFRGQSKIFPFAMHRVSNPIIEVTGDRATGAWTLFQPCTVNRPDGPEAAWIAGGYSDIYVREDGQWLFEFVAIKMHFVTPYADGWVKTPMAMPSF
jgi:hypothetical protein